MNRTARTLFIKIGKRLDKQQFELADMQQELKVLKRKLADIRAKSKRKQAVNPNKLFIRLNDIHMALNRPLVLIDAATATQDAPEEVPAPQEADLRPVDAFQAVTVQLQAISYS